MSKLRLVAVGDVHPNRERPEEIFELVAPYLQGDLRYCELECTLSGLGTLRTDVRNPAHRVPPHNISALTTPRFDVVSFASNNALDYGVEAFLDTIDRLRKENIVVFGAGRNLEEARQPALVERNGVRLAFVIAGSILPKGYAATPNGPGIAPLRVRTFYEPVEDIYEQPGTPARTVTIPDPDDLTAVLDSIRRAKQKADLVVACFHWGVHFTHDLAIYQPEVAYAAVDAGADLVLGTHPHCLQAFDTYKGSIIAYSLGNFVFEQDPVSRTGVSQYLSFYGIPIDLENPRVPHPKHTKLTLILTVDVDGTSIKRVAFRPAIQGPDARPRVVRPSEPQFTQVVELLRKLSAELGTELVVEGEEVVIQPRKRNEIDTRALLQRRRMSYPSLRWLATEVL